MADRPILFSAPMVRALLAGTKTQTRRVLKPGKKPAMILDGRGVLLDPSLAPPTYCVGDRLWVKETWKPGAWREDGRVACDYRASPDLVHTPWCSPDNFEDLWPKWTDELVAAGSVPDADGIHHWEPGKSPLKWHPSIFMPRWASRITLLVTDVRVERLQAISEEDAIAEGIERDAANPSLWKRGTLAGDQNTATVTNFPVLAYRSLWDSINGSGAWDENPWICAITFTVAHRNIDQ